MVTKENTWLVLFAIVLSSSFQVLALELKTSVDRNPVMIDEAFTLTITATGDVDREAFQSDVLLKDFIVGNTSVSSQTQMVNFNTTRSTTWRTTLFPKSEGVFVIPSIDIDGFKTQAVSVRVIPVPSVSSQEQRDFFVTAELDQKSVYVQQHVNYTVKLHMAANIERGSLQAPEMQNARVEQVGDDEQYSDIVNGKRFQIIERTFVIIPEQSGQFTIQAPIFSGEVLANNSRQSFGFFNRTRNITRRGPQLNIDVLPIPASVTSAWLPGEFVELTESYPEDKAFVVGEPITRTITLTVAGQTEEQLPEIEQIYPPSVKTYPDQAETASAQRDGMLIAQRTESTALIPTVAGDVVLPGVRMEWFNTRTGQTEVASIPARTITVESASAEPFPTGIPIATNSADLPVPDAPTNSSALKPATDFPTLWVSVSSFFAILWLVTLIAWWRARSGDQKASPPSNKPSVGNSISTEALVKSLANGEMQTSQSMLLYWLRERLQSEFASLHEALDHPASAEIKAQYHQLTASRFSPSGQHWSSKAFSDALLKLEQTQLKSRKQSQSALPELYPS